MKILPIKSIVASLLLATASEAQQTSADAPTVPRRRLIEVPTPTVATAPGVPANPIIPIVDDRPNLTARASLSFGLRSYPFVVVPGGQGDTLVRRDDADSFTAGVLRGYPDGVLANLQWSAPVGSIVRATLMRDPHGVIGRGTIVQGGSAEGQAIVGLTRGSWAWAGPAYIELHVAVPGAPAIVWCSAPFLLIKPEDDDAALRGAARHFSENWPALYAEAKRFTDNWPTLHPPTPVAVTVAPPLVFTRDLTIGSRGADVAALYSFLESKGFLVMPRGSAKDHFGPILRSALAKWQQLCGISPPSGYFGPITRAAVNAALESAP